MILEKDLESRLVSIVKARGGVCLKWVCPGWAGVPDRIVLLPGGRIYFIELKRPKDGRLSERQKWWRERILGLGFDYCVIWNQGNLETFQILLDYTQ